MTTKEEFLKEKEKCDLKFYHIEDGITDPKLKEIDEMFGAADALSIKYAGIHQKNLKITAFLASALVLFFLIYEAAEQHYMIIPCVAVIALLVYHYIRGKKQRADEKYLEYRLLAEIIRVHYFLLIAKVETPVTKIIPWFLHNAVPWACEIIKEFPKVTISKKRSIMNCWVRDQEEYHNNAHVKTRNQKDKNELIEKIVLFITVAGYLAGAIFEAYLILHFPMNEMLEHELRALLKIIIGIGTVVLVFVGSYYGSISLSSKIEEHRRMEMMYQKARNRIFQQKAEENDEFIIHLAREFLVENATWYAHQKENKLELKIE